MLLCVLGFPLLGGLVLALVGHWPRARDVNVVFSAGTFLSACVLTMQVVSQGPQRVWGDLFFIDPLNVFLVTLTAFDNIDHALHLANQSSYGLAGYLFTDSARTILKVSDQLEVGSLAINGMGVSVPEAPFGGLKDSGYGSESGIEGMEAFLDTKFTHHCA